MPPVYEFQGTFRFLSNFYVEEDGTSVEHAYQAAKTVNPIEKQMVLQCETPGQAKRMGQKVTIREDWEEIKDGVMLALVRNKFNKSKHLADMLLMTGEAELQEGNNWGDTYWGVDLRTGVGQNKLGKILMKVRDEIRSNRSAFSRGEPRV